MMVVYGDHSSVANYRGEMTECCHQNEWEAGGHLYHTSPVGDERSYTAQALHEIWKVLPLTNGCKLLSMLQTATT